MSARAELVEIARQRVRAHYEEYASGAWKGLSPRDESIIDLVVDAVESALRAQIEAEYEQVGWCDEYGELWETKAKDSPYFHESWEPVYRRVAEIGATPE